MSMLQFFLLCVFWSLSSHALINGSPAHRLQFKSSVYFETLRTNCTGVKIAPKAFLTAAHCVYDGYGIIYHYRPSNQLELKTHYDAAYLLEIEETIAHPSYIGRLRQMKEQGLQDWVTGMESFDVAVIKVKDLSPQIPVAKISFDLIESGEAVVIGGHGKGSSSYDIRRTHSSTIESVEVFAQGILENNQRHYFVFATRGGFGERFQSSLAPGDSGGPVYRSSDGTVVGINSLGVMPFNRDVSFANIHTRLNLLKGWFTGLEIFE